MTVGNKAADGSAARPSQDVDAAAKQAAAQESARLAAEQAAAEEAARAAAERATAEQAARAAAEQASADEAARVAADQSAANEAEQAQVDLYETGWYDDRGWVSPETGARARDAGIEAGGNVPNYLRCGTICGESPTSGEVQQQWLEEQGLLNPDGSLTNDPCTGGYQIRGTCYPSVEAARAAGEGE